MCLAADDKQAGRPEVGLGKPRRPGSQSLVRPLPPAPLCLAPPPGKGPKEAPRPEKSPRGEAHAAAAGQVWKHLPHPKASGAASARPAPLRYSCGCRGCAPGLRDADGQEAAAPSSPWGRGRGRATGKAGASRLAQRARGRLKACTTCRAAASGCSLASWPSALAQKKDARNRLTRPAPTPRGSAARRPQDAPRPRSLRSCCASETRREAPAPSRWPAARATHLLASESFPAWTVAAALALPSARPRFQGALWSLRPFSFLGTAKGASPWRRGSERTGGRGSATRLEGSWEAVRGRVPRSPHQGTEREGVWQSSLGGG